MSKLEELYKNEHREDAFGTKFGMLFDDLVSQGDKMRDAGIKSITSKIDKKTGETVLKVDGKTMSVKDFNAEYGDDVLSLSINNLRTIAMTEDENVMDAIKSISTPAKTRSEMAERFVDILGYDATTYYDDVEMRDILRKIESEVNSEFDEDEILRRANEIYCADRTFNQATALKKAMIEIGVDEKAISKITEYIGDMSVSDYDDDEELDMDEFDDIIDEDTSEPIDFDESEDDNDDDDIF